MQTATRRALEILALLAVTYQSVSVIYSVHGALEFYYFHLGLVLVLAALSVVSEQYAAEGSRRATGILLVCALLVLGSVASTGYFHFEVSAIEIRQPFITPLDFAAGAVMIVCVIVLTYFIWGAVLSGLIVLAILYFCFGNFIPGALNYSPPGWNIIMSYLAGMGGARGVIWGIPLSANTLFLIIVFGGLLKGGRILELFNEVGKLMLKVSRAGIAYSAILASTLIGMVTGQAVANIALSGSVTIPSMKQRGLSAESASAIEVNASLASQLVPPIMGLGAFLMAVNLGIPYVDVALAAVIPAALYVASLVLSVRFLVAATPGIDSHPEPVDWGRILWILPSFLIGFGTLLALLYLRYSPGYAAFWANGLLLVLSLLRPAAHRPSMGELLSGIVYGVVAAVHLGLILGGIGLLIQVLITTGAGLEFGRVMMTASGGEVWLALVFGMALSLIAGLGLPTPAAYALIAIIMIPFLIDLGVPDMAAHFFGFYFAIFSAITPPVAVGVMAASRISGASFYRTVLHAMRLAMVPLLIPFTLVAFPNVLGFPDVTLETVIVCLTLLAVTAAWAGAIYGFLFQRLTLAERAVLILGPILYIGLLASKNFLYAAAIFALVIVVTLFRLIRRNAVGENAAKPGR